MGFNQCILKIEQEYVRLGHNLGWSFLYTPRKTFSSKTKFVFIGYNPGGSTYQNPQRSYQAGNEYRLNPWNNGQFTPLQKQVIELYKQVANKSGQPYESLMDETLAANFCPFRSPNAATLHNSQNTIIVCHELWASIFQNLFINETSKVIVCCGIKTFDSIITVLIKAKYKVPEPSNHLTHWSNSGGPRCKFYKETRITSGHESIYVLGLPHLSQCRFIDAKRCWPAVNRFVDEIVKTL